MTTGVKGRHVFGELHAHAELVEIDRELVATWPPEVGTWHRDRTTLDEASLTQAVENLVARGRGESPRARAYREALHRLRAAKRARRGTREGGNVA